MSTELRFSINSLNSIKDNSFNEYSEIIKQAYDNFNEIRSSITGDAYLDLAWCKTATYMDNLACKRDNMLNWFTNYIENAQRLENSLPDSKFSVIEKTTSRIYKNHGSLSLSNVDLSSYMSTKKGAKIEKPAPVVTPSASSSGSSGSGTTKSSTDSSKSSTDSSKSSTDSSKSSSKQRSSKSVGSNNKSTSSSTGRPISTKKTSSAINTSVDKRFQSPSKTTSAINTSVDKRYQSPAKTTSAINYKTDKRFTAKGSGAPNTSK